MDGTKESTSYIATSGMRGRRIVAEKAKQGPSLGSAVRSTASLGHTNRQGVGRSGEHFDQVS